jgi:hypothetical protein
MRGGGEEEQEGEIPGNLSTYERTG